MHLCEKYQSVLNGCIIYDPNIVSYSGDLYSFTPNDANMATVNVTAMLCAKYNAIALTAAQRNTLINTYGVTLNILFDTTNQWSTWDAAYNYAYNNLRSDTGTDIIAHIPTFYFGMMDYTIQQKIFTYHRVLPNPTSAQNAMEDSILGITPSNTPVIGVWALGADEGGLVAKVTNAGKFFTVTHETFNLSWTSGLPLPALTNTPKRNLTLDTSKVYVACNVSEGDNVSYDTISLPVNFGKSTRTVYPMGWELTSTLRELAPNVASYYYNNLGNSIVICSVSGVGYVNPMPPTSSRQGFYDLTSSYMQTAGEEIVKTMFNDSASANDYTKISCANGVIRGYWDSDGTNSMVNGKPVMGNNFFDTQSNNIKNYSGPTPAFFSIAIDGWNNGSDQWKAWCDTLPSNFVVVTPAELVKLYSDYQGGNAVTASSSLENSDWGAAKVVDGQTASVPGSMGWTSTNSTTSNHTEWIKLNLGSTQSINKVDLYPRNDGVNTGYGFPIDFTIQVSTDNTNWTTVATQTGYALPGNAVQSFTFSSQTARYVKITGTNLRYNPNDSLNPYRMQFAEIVVNFRSVTASSSVENSDWGAAKAIDGQGSSVPGSMGWSSSNSTQSNHTEWVQLCLGATQTINKVDLYPRNDGVNTGYGFPIDFTIQVSTDNTNWTTVATQTGYALPGNAVQSFTFSSQTARYVKITGTNLRYNLNDSLNPYRMQFAEIEAYNSGAPLYSEDFNDGLAQNWTVVNGTWAVESNEYSGTNLSDEAISYYSPQNFNNFTYTGTLRYISGTTDNDAYALFRYQDSNNYYMLYLSRSAGNQYLKLYKKVGGTFIQIGSQQAYNPPLDTNINFTITCNGISINASVNDGTNNPSVSATDYAYSSGKIGLRVYQAHVHYDNITVY